MNGKKGFIETEMGLIPEEWKLLTVDDIKSIEKKAIISGPFGSNIGSRYFVESGIPVIRGNNLKADMTRFIDDGFVFLTFEKATELNTWAERNDLIFTAAGTLGQVGIIPKNSKYEKYIISNKQLRLRVNDTIIRPLFAFYWFSSPIMVSYIQQRNTGSTIPLINLSVLRSLPIPVPSVDIQDRIINIVDSLDSKIALNRQMNSTLEAIGQALFRRWFVDFEFPDEEGKPYRSSGGEMVETELGEVPKGWSTKKIRDLAAINEKSMDKQYKHDAIEYIDISSVTVGRLTETKIYTLKDAPSRAKRLVKHGDTIWSTVRPNLKSFLYIDSPPENLVVSTGFAVLTPKHIPSTFLYHWVTTADFINYLSYRADGSAYPAVNTAYIADADIIFPSQDILTEFDKVVSPMQDQIAHNEKQSQTLTSIRDALLPKLMSGEIRVRTNSNLNKENK